MQVEQLGLEGLLLLQPRVFGDDRGHFFEVFNDRAFKEATDLDLRFVQDNESSSRKNVLRGLHFQLAAHAQGKLVRVVKGAVLDVVVDIRPNSSTYGKHEKIVLTGSGKQLLWVPPGFAHGFLTLKDNTIFAYKCTAYYDQAAERTIRWNDPLLAIDWGINEPNMSAKDKVGLPFPEDPSNPIV